MKEKLVNWMVRCKRHYMDYPLSYKMIMIYIIAVFLPTMFLISVFLQIDNKELERTYYENQVNNIVAARENMAIKLSQLSASYNFFRSADVVLDFLNRDSESVSDTLFIYFKEIVPLFSAIKQDSYVMNVGIYGNYEYYLDMQHGLANINSLNMDPQLIEQIKNSQELWLQTWENGAPVLYYYHCLYSGTFPYNRGILEIQVDFDSISENFFMQLGYPFYYIQPDGRALEYGSDGFLLYEEIPETLTEKHIPFYTLYLAEGCLEIQIPILPPENWDGQAKLILFSVTILGMIFITAYLMTNKAVTGRLKSFAAHISTTNVEELTPFKETDYRDEVGLAIRAYNGLVDRVNFLVHENLQAQLQRKESEYYALQAQIRPHFLYNTLENIRMSAESHQDTETADMLLVLGKHMRYSLNMSSHPVLLEEELYFGQNYLRLYKMRDNMIDYEILISAEIDHVLCPRFLLQPLLENALIHGYSLEKGLHIRILVEEGEAWGKTDCVRLSIEDNGNGIEEESLKNIRKKLSEGVYEEADHVGILNVNSRLEIFTGIRKQCLFIDSIPGTGTSIIFYLRRGDIYGGRVE